MSASAKPPARTAATVAVELAIILPALLIFILGIIDMGRLIWTQTTLDHAVAQAARCGAVNATLCGTGPAIQNFAVSEAMGLAVTASVFSVAVAPCGVQVTATYEFAHAIPWFTLAKQSMTATSCLPH
jgi:Flp pilus assembly protein TadG